MNELIMKHRLSRLNLYSEDEIDRLIHLLKMRGIIHVRIKDYNETIGYVA